MAFTMFSKLRVIHPSRTSIIVLLFSLIFVIPLFLKDRWNDNLFYLQVLHVIQNKPDQLDTVYQNLSKRTTSSNPHKQWFLGLLANEYGNHTLEEIHLVEFLTSGGVEALFLVNAKKPQDATLAQMATRLYPEQSESWLWYGNTLRTAARNQQAVEAYQKSVDLDPTQWSSWCWLGYLYRDQNLLLSRDSYSQCCLYGNNGANGCLHAGKVSEKLGEYDMAQYFYRLAGETEK